MNGQGKDGPGRLEGRVIGAKLCVAAQRMRFDGVITPLGRITATSEHARSARQIRQCILREISTAA